MLLAYKPHMNIYRFCDQVQPVDYQHLAPSPCLKSGLSQERYLPGGHQPKMLLPRLRDNLRAVATGLLSQVKQYHFMFTKMDQ
jgi:hypothetical protein